jgi:hypothetical protein
MVGLPAAVRSEVAQTCFLGQRLFGGIYGANRGPTNQVRATLLQRCPGRDRTRRLLRLT